MNMIKKKLHSIKSLLLWAVVLGIGSVFLQSCGPDDPEPKPDKTLEIKVNHTFGAKDIPFLLNTSYVEYVSGDTFTPTTLIYHINFFELSNASGDRLALDANAPYRMVDLGDPKSLTVMQTTIKADLKIFTTLSFTLGVEDSLANDQGLLNSVFTSPMYWGMINGYIHHKVEGNLHSKTSKSVVLHVGGYKSPYKLARRITIPLSEPIDLSKGNASLTILKDMQKYFDGTYKINMNTVNLIHQPGDDAKKIADNWSGMFTDGGIEYK